MAKRNPLEAAHLGEMIWFVPFVCIGLMALSLVRPRPEFPAPARSRIVIDAQGTKVPVALPFRGSVLAWCGFGAEGYLEKTQAPQTLLDYGGARDRADFARGLMGLVYPQALKDDRLWAGKATNPYGGLRNHFPDLEFLLAYDAGAYLGDCGNTGVVPLLRTVGLPGVLLMSRAKNWDESIFQEARVDTSLVGMPERGEVLIARYRQAFADIQRDLHPETLAYAPRVLIMGTSGKDWRYSYVKSYRNSYQIYFRPVGIENAARKDNTGERQDAERILAMDPDIIFLTGSRDSRNPTEGPAEFMHDPRWRGLKAVREKRVYRMLGGGGLGGLIYQPIYSRWMAEVAHPDRMPPRIRQVVRAWIATQFDCRVSDDYIDRLLNVEENKDSAGGERFMRDYQPAKEESKQ
ncbi:MAG: ABC transporter substrate-binding protein [Bryobacteraceae bacterium]